MSALWLKAQESAKSARLLLERGGYDGASNRAFFAMFNASRALLASRGLNSGKISGHAKLRALLTLHFVESGRMHPDQAIAFRRAEKVRRAADFKPASVEARIATELVGSMDDFMKLAKQLLATKCESRR